jgi:hypothetical protein
VVALVAASLYSRADANWWLFAGLFLVPDLGLLGYLANARVGALTYNAVHTLLPLALWVLAADGSLPRASPSSGWRIGLDRVMGSASRPVARSRRHAGPMGRASPRHAGLTIPAPQARHCRQLLRGVCER